MSFDKKVFKKQYGSPYITRIKCTIIACLAVMLIFAVLILLDIQIPYIMGLGLGLIAFVSIIPCLPLFASQYIKAIKTAQRQKQWIENGKLCVMIVPEDGFTWGAIITHTMNYCVEILNSTRISKRFIEIDGVIQLTDTYNGNVTNRNVTHFKIPRCFSGEEEIIRLGGSYHD